MNHRQLFIYINYYNKKLKSRHYFWNIAFFLCMFANVVIKNHYFLTY